MELQMRKRLVVLFVALSTVLFFNGCKTISDSLVEDDAGRSGDQLVIVSYDPPLPATLQPFEKMTVTVQYTIDSVDQAFIFVRPYSFGPPTQGASCHPSPMYNKGNGTAEGWFFCVKPTYVDQVCVTMVPECGNSKWICSQMDDVDIHWAADE